ncbi:alcohol dehydrogenase catalytic domain-containing protein [Bacillus sp. CECT 9360]|uniref:zinc-dependent alcohol dehydrogenase n=1 Tax=Bacillus sp. CECT 9360 TaxID=2845821 RepID=UPI001E41B1AC|nr:alcohol dehydrogenase catalytic domain-containing protein [Bacillus sp. CECT 9360]CAH0343852.1 L-threonine 3-dehydrogenase [Bacillus sp. CECT 9360]
MPVMKAGLFVSEKSVMVADLEKPILQVGEALIKVSAAGICGTDMMIYFGKHPRAKAPLAMGHEFSGVIEQINGSSSFTIGDRVVVEPTLSCGKCEACATGQFHVCKTLKLIGIDMHGGFAEYTAVPLNRLHRIPDQLSDQHAALTEPVAVAVHTVRRSNLKIGDNVVILGGGPIGLLVGIMAKKAGAAQIIVSDISPYRLNKAKELGLTVLDAKKVNIADEVYSLTNGVGADITFEVAGTAVTAIQMVEVTKIQGQIVVVSVYKQPPTIDLAAMHFRETSLTTTRCYSRNDFEKAIQLMGSGMIDVSFIISHQLPLEKIKEGFELMENPDLSLKIILQPN